MDEDNSPSLLARKILGIAGSLRQASYNCAALRAAQELAPKGCAIEVFNRAGIPPFNQGEEGNPPARVLELKAAVREADAILLVTPEYNYRFRACSRTPSTGRRAHTAITPGKGNRSRSWALQLVRTAALAPNIICANASFS
jgi:NADPH-dependent FMN reductase